MIFRWCGSWCYDCSEFDFTFYMQIYQNIPQIKVSMTPCSPDHEEQGLKTLQWGVPEETSQNPLMKASGVSIGMLVDGLISQLLIGRHASFRTCPKTHWDKVTHQASSKSVDIIKSLQRHKFRPFRMLDGLISRLLIGRYGQFSNFSENSLI